GSRSRQLEKHQASDSSAQPANPGPYFLGRSLLSGYNRIHVFEVSQSSLQRGGAAGPRNANARAGCPLCQPPSAPAPFFGRTRTGNVRNGVLLGRGAEILGAAWRLYDRRRIRRRTYAESDVQGSLQRDDGARGSRARRLRPTQDHLRRSLEGLLGEPRSNTGDAPRQRRRHPVSVWYLLLQRGSAARGRSDQRCVSAAARGRGVRRGDDGDSSGSRVLL